MAAERLLPQGQNPRIEASVKPGLAHQRGSGVDERWPAQPTPPAEHDNPPVDDHARPARLPALGDPRHRAAPELDAEGRLPAGSVPGWGLSWRLHEQGLLPGWEQLSMQARLDRLNDYWRGLNQGWGAAIPPGAG